MANFDAPLDEEDAMEPPTDKWTIEDYDPETDDPPEGHHAQPVEDPPDIPRPPGQRRSVVVTALMVAAFVAVVLIVMFVR